MTDLRDFIKRRRKEIEREGQPLAARRQELEDEMRRIDQRFAEMRLEWTELEKAAKAIALEVDSQIEPAVEGRKPSVTIKEGILKLLADVDGGMTSQDILHNINQRYFQGKIERTSFSPQLSRLKGEGRITSQGSLYFLTGESKKGPDVGTSEPSQEVGGGIGRADGYPPEEPRGSIPLTSTASAVEEIPAQGENLFD